MKKTVKNALLFSSVGLMVACGVNKKKTENTMTNNADKGIVLADMDITVRPQDDFYNYVNARKLMRTVCLF